MKRIVQLTPEQNKLYEEYQSALEFNDKINDKIEVLQIALDKSKNSNILYADPKYDKSDAVLRKIKN